MIIQILGIDLLPDHSNWLAIVSGCGGLLIFFATIYGIGVVLPNFVKQKRIEHLSDNARSALTVLIEAEEALKKLFFAVKIQADEGAHRELQVEVSLALNKLRNMLLLIVKNAEVPENFIKDAHLQQLEDLVQLLNEKTQHFPLKLADILVLVDKDWTHHNRINLGQLEQLRDILVKIHGMNDKVLKK